MRTSKVTHAIVAAVLALLLICARAQTNNRFPYLFCIAEYLHMKRGKK